MFLFQWIILTIWAFSLARDTGRTLVLIQGRAALVELTQSRRTIVAPELTGAPALAEQDALVPGGVDVVVHQGALAASHQVTAGRGIHGLLTA